MARLNKMAEIIRERRIVAFGEFCANLQIAPSTMYGYIRALKNMYVDIAYEKGFFMSTADRKVEEVANQRRLTA